MAASPVTLANNSDDDSVTPSCGDARQGKRNRDASSPLADCTRTDKSARIASFNRIICESTPTPTMADSELGSSARSEADSTTATQLKNQRRSKTQVRRVDLLPEKELVACHARIAASTSLVYIEYEPPVVAYELDGSATHNAFECKRCKTVVKRVIEVTETSGLKGHIRTCNARAGDNQEGLDGFGITGGHPTRLLPEQVREWFAIWMAESARPFNQAKYRGLRKLLHPDARKNVPHPDTISRDIKTLYEATQLEIKDKLAAHEGCFHIVLDLFQSGNGLDFLGIVIFYHFYTKDKSPDIKRFMLECLDFGGKHTGVALVKAVHGVMHKFNIEDRVWGVVCDNASNNSAMMKELQKYKLKRLVRPKARVHCVLHVLNLVSQAIALPFRTKRQLV